MEATCRIGHSHSSEKAVKTRREQAEGGVGALGWVAAVVGRGRGRNGEGMTGNKRAETRRGRGVVGIR